MGPGGASRASPALGEVQSLISRVSNACKDSDVCSSTLRINDFCNDLRELRHHLVDSNPPRKAKDAFRHANGFETFFDAIRVFSESLAESKTFDDLRTDRFETLKCGLMTISEALFDHPRNRQYCAESKGWGKLERALGKFVLEMSKTTNELSLDAVNEQQQFFGLLFAIALCEDSFISMFRANQTEELYVPYSNGSTVPLEDDLDGKQIDGSKSRLKSHIFNPTDFLWNPEVVPIIFKFWSRARASIETYSRDVFHEESNRGGDSSFDNSPQYVGLMRALTLQIVLALTNLARANSFNAVAMHESKVSTAVLKTTFSSEASCYDHSSLTELSTELFKLGTGTLEDAEHCFQRAENSANVCQTLLAGIEDSRDAPHLLFDLSMHGFASLEFPQLRSPFPPKDISEGYTLAAWIRVIDFDESCHTTIFGAFDSSQICFVLLYLEFGTHQLVLQTSISSKTPSVRFKSVTFREKKWYHIAIVHHRRRGMSPSRVSLYVDGDFREQKKCQYPESPMVRAEESNVQSRSQIHHTPAPVQCFFGTPQDLSQRLGKNVLSSRWALASAHLFYEALSEDLILVYCQMGPSYRGNFQDRLGSFQTYQASTILNLRNEERLANDEANSTITTAIRSKASKLTPEQNISLSISPHAVLSMHDPDRYSSWNIKTKVTIDNHFSNVSSQLLVNAAIPVIAKAITKPSGLGSIMGGVVVYRPSSVEDSCWRISGCVVTFLRLVAQATSPKSLLLALKVALELISQNWRNSEAMERGSGFGILAWILRVKLFPDSSTASEGIEKVVLEDSRADGEPSLTESLLRLILDFVGFDFKDSKKSTINNPLAYRQLIVDCNVWEKSDQATQKLYFRQFVVFASQCYNRSFNTRRLNRMRIAKRFIDTMKSCTITKDAVPYMLSAFKVILERTVTAEVLRSLALYITYALFANESSQMRPGFKKVIENDQIGAPTGTELGIEALELLASFLCDTQDNSRIHKFARTVTSKDNIRVIIPATKILVRVLITGGPKYLAKFDDKHGFVILRRRLQRWWYVREVWSHCWALLFGPDYSQLDFDDPIVASTLVQALPPHDPPEFFCPGMIRIMLAMAETCLKESLSQKRPVEEETNEAPLDSNDSQQGLSETTNLQTGLPVVISAVETLLALHRFRAFHVLSTSRHFSKDLLAVLYAVVKDNVENKSDLTELTKGDEVEPSFQEDISAGKPDTAVNRDPRSPSSSNTVRKDIDSASHPPLRVRRNSSFVMVSANQSGKDSHQSIIKPLAPSTDFSDEIAFNHSLFQQLVKLLVAILVYQVIHQKDYSGLGLYLKAPSSTVEKRSSINSLVLRATITEMMEEIDASPRLLHDPKILANLARFTQQTYEAILEGWLTQGAAPLLDFMAKLLGYLGSPDVRVLKSIRLCSPTISLMEGLFWRLSLHELFVTDEQSAEGMPTSTSKQNGDEAQQRLLADLLTWSEILFGQADAEDPSINHPKSDPVLLHALCYMLCQKIMNGSEATRGAALDLYRIVLSQCSRQLSAAVADENLEETWLEFSRTVMTYPERVPDWLSKNCDKLDRVLQISLKVSLIQFLHRENVLSQATGNSRVAKRKERLHQWHLNDLADQHAWTEHDLATAPWAANICESELFKHFRARQDLQDGQEYFEALYFKYDSMSRRQRIPMNDDPLLKWSLDETEGRIRMRMRLLPSKDAQDLQYNPKRRQTITHEANSRSKDLRHKPSNSVPIRQTTTDIEAIKEISKADDQIAAIGRTDLSEPSPAEDYEIVQDVEDDLEDKNRKVMRSLQRGEQVHFVYNVSRIRGLEACESILIIGEKSLYLLSHLFQRSDGEIVNEWQAPANERDPYTQMITGREIKRAKGKAVPDVETGTRHWTWSQIISVSKRRFLSRPVGLEVFFQDGRSYLLTAMSEPERNKLYSNLLDRAVKLRSSGVPDEDAWRVELLPDPREPPQTVGSRLASVFSLGSLLPATARWIKGEISNFQYLMMVNTVAGRTFNDLTQYPVFPWVIADYTSERLDLDNPKTYRDLTKPMGCQSPDRESSFRERFQAFAEMNENETLAFHYGTHYSTAMIVTSYLIRLQPFVDAYLLLQGGTFDHADRLFYSIEKAWLSASRETMTDVRELTPEFFYLPEFLTNINNYNFGFREANGEKINNVELPPWAKGDPELFVAKNREALESPYVSQNLHNWIDLVFGFKQRGEAAIEAVNVFHHLSYQDATDLETIGDGLERLATIGIIHNFGQTPAQVFNRPHERRESTGSKTKRLHQVIESLHRLPAPIYKHHSQICQLDYAQKQQRLLCCGPFRSFMPSKYNVVVEWGHTDNSIRFYNAESKKPLGLFEQPHQDDITCARFVDNTLVTASRDCTVAVWTVKVSADAVDLQIQGSLFGHRLPVSLLRVSRPLSTILSVDTSGRVLLWDINGLDLVREIFNTRPVQYAQINSSNGHIVLCCDQRVLVYTLNGKLLLDQSICTHPNDRVHCCSFYESSGSEWIDTELIFTGQRWGVVNVWRVTTAPDGMWMLELIRRLDHVDRTRTDGRNMPCAITAICPLDHNLYTGDENGNVFEWACSR